MYWFRRPPYVRWSIAALVAGLAVVAELRGSPTVTHPFASAPIAAGEPLDGGAVEYRDVPPGVLPPVELTGARAARPVAAGDPLLPADVGSAPLAPPGWWVVPLQLPDLATPGQEVAIVLTDSGETAPGVVLAANADDDFGTTAPGLVAVPADQAAAVAQAAARDAVAVLLAPASQPLG